MSHVTAKLSKLADGGFGELRITLDVAAIREFKKLLDRGLNTWDDAPEWMFKMDTRLRSLIDPPSTDPSVPGRRV